MLLQQMVGCLLWRMGLTSLVELPVVATLCRIWLGWWTTKLQRRRRLSRRQRLRPKQTQALQLPTHPIKSGNHTVSCCGFYFLIFISNTFLPRLNPFSHLLVAFSRSKERIWRKSLPHALWGWSFRWTMHFGPASTLWSMSLKRCWMSFLVKSSGVP